MAAKSRNTGRFTENTQFKKKKIGLGEQIFTRLVSLRVRRKTLRLFRQLVKINYSRLNDSR